MKIDDQNNSNTALVAGSSATGLLTPTVAPHFRASCPPVPAGQQPNSIENLSPPALRDDGRKPQIANPTTGRKRTGAVARLSKELRRRVNELLDDNLTYAQVVHELGEDGKDLDNDSIRRWKKGGYQDYLRDQRLLEQWRQHRAHIPALLSNGSHVGGFQAAQQIAAGQILEILTESGADFLREALQANPMNYFRMLNAFSRITNGGLKCERLALEQQDREVQALAAKGSPKTKGLSDEAVAEMKSKLKLM